LPLAPPPPLPSTRRLEHSKLQETCDALTGRITAATAEAEVLREQLSAAKAAVAQKEEEVDRNAAEVGGGGDAWGLLAPHIASALSVMGTSKPYRLLPCAVGYVGFGLCVLVVAKIGKGPLPPLWVLGDPAMCHAVAVLWRVTGDPAGLPAAGQ
jgi:hypothetical protein